MVQRKQRDVDCPLCIVDYNRYMGGVDTGDQYRKYHVRVSHISISFGFCLKFVYSTHFRQHDISV